MDRPARVGRRDNSQQRNKKRRSRKGVGGGHPICRGASTIQPPDVVVKPRSYPPLWIPANSRIAPRFSHVFHAFSTRYPPDSHRLSTPASPRSQGQSTTAPMRLWEYARRRCTSSPTAPFGVDVRDGWTGTNNRARRGSDEPGVAAPARAEAARKGPRRLSSKVRYSRPSERCSSVVPVESSGRGTC